MEPKTPRKDASSAGPAEASGDPRRLIPRTDEILALPAIAPALEVLGAARVKAAIAGAQDRARAREIDPSDVVDAARAELDDVVAHPTTLTPVINATGVVLHTNLGRAPLTEAAREALLVAAEHVDVEFDLDTGQRSRRGRGTLAALLDAMPAAEDALVVNNGAAALALAATALAGPGGDIVVSRGELIEIGDGFRLPDLLESTGARLREVGTTNRTALADYLAGVEPAAAGPSVVARANDSRLDGEREAGRAIAQHPRRSHADDAPPAHDERTGAQGPDAQHLLRPRADASRADAERPVAEPPEGRVDTARATARFVLKVHPSNYVVSGFTATVAIATLSEALAPRRIPLVVDIGSGLLHPEPVLPDEPDATTALAAGADLVIASGDKLLGGPQAGIVLGRADLIERLRRHPLARALRVDKLTLAALEATLRRPETRVSVALRADPDALRRRTEALAATLGLSPDAVVPADGAVGGGGAPGLTLPGWALALPESYAAPMRRGDPPIVARVHRGRCLVDLRCVPPSDDERIAIRLGEIAAAPHG